MLDWPSTLGLRSARAHVDVKCCQLGHPPTLWRAWWTLGTALAQAGRDDEAAAAAAAAANMLRTFAATLAPRRSGPLLAAEPSREILLAAGFS